MVVQIGKSDYSGWLADESLLSRDSLVLCGGCGTQIDFESELSTRFQCQVVLLDPTPEAYQWFRQQPIESRRRIFYIIAGMGHIDQEIPFYHHKNGGFVTRSVIPGGAWNSEPEFQSKVWKISSLMKKLDWDRVDYLKLNLGGDYEFNILHTMLEEQVYPKQIGVLRMHWSNKRKSILDENLSKNGYFKAGEDSKQGTLYIRG